MNEAMIRSSLHLIAQEISKLTEELSKGRLERKHEFDWFKSHAGLATKHDLEEMKYIINMNAQQLEALLNNQTTQIAKIAKEQSDRFDTLTDAINNLQGLLDAGNVSDAISTAAENVQTALDSLDAAIPDAVPTTA